MLQTATRIERRSSDKLGTLRRCLEQAFRPEITDVFDDLLAKIDAAEGRATPELQPMTREGTVKALEGFRALARGEIMVISDLAESGPSLFSIDQMMPLMLAACPSFQEHWDTFYKEDVVEQSKGDQQLPETLPLYLAVHDLAHHLIRRLESGHTTEFDSVFKVVEKWIVEGSESVRAVAIQGFLEDLLLPHFYFISRPTELLRWVGPRTYKWWVESTGFWDRLAASKLAANQY